MGLAEVLVDLSALLDDPNKNAEAIYTLLRQNDTLAEYEVARFFVADRMAPDIAMRLRSVDPAVRLAAVTLIPLVCPRSAAAKLLRPVVKDPDITTRKRARHVVRELDIGDVALKDSRFKPNGWSKGPLAPGAYNPSGWAFGLYARKRRGKLDTSALGQHGLPSLADREDVAEFLGCANDEAFAALLRPGTSRGSAYVEFEVPKATGGMRRIAAPRKPLRMAQRKVLDAILSKVPVHAAAHGFVSSRSTVTNAEAHVGRALVLKLDLVDFFPSIHYRRVVGLFESLGYPTKAAEALAGVCTYRPKLADGRMVWPGLLPQGAPSSPAITNLVCRRLDARLSALAKKVGGRYTRYADDLTFSSPRGERPASDTAMLLARVRHIVGEEGFALNPKKGRVQRASRRQTVTGIVVNERPSVPRDEVRRLRAVLHQAARTGLEAQNREGIPHFEAHLRGKLAYLHMVDPEKAAPMIARFDALVAAGK
jgi:retron-type reverse transcriptase